MVGPDAVGDLAQPRERRAGVAPSGATAITPRRVSDPRAGHQVGEGARLARRDAARGPGASSRLTCTVTSRRRPACAAPRSRARTTLARSTDWTTSA